MAGTTNKGSGRWQEQVDATQEETIEFDSMFLESSNEQTGLGLTLEVSDGAGSPTFASLQGINSVTLTITGELIDVINNDTSGWREIEPSTRSIEMSIDRDYVDPASDTAFDHLLTMADNGAVREVRLGLQAFQFNFDAHLTEEGSESPHDDLATSPITLASTGKYSTLTKTNQDAGLSGLLDKLVADPPGSFSTLIEVVDPTGTQVTGATKYENTSYVESIEIELPIEDAASVSGTLANDGVPTRTTQ